MADKKISELQALTSVTDALLIPGDNTIQTYKFTAAQLKAYVFAAMTGLSAVTPDDADYFPLIDTSDANNLKKGLISNLRTYFGSKIIRAVITTDTCANTDDVLLLSGASFTETLFTAVGNTGKIITLKHKGTSLTQVYTINTTSSQTIDGISSGTYKLYTNGEVLKLISNGANWEIVNHLAETQWANLGVITFTATTTAPTKPTSVSIDKFIWKRKGTELFARIAYNPGSTLGASNGSGDYLIGLSSFGTIDTTQVGTGGSAGNAQVSNVFGAGQIHSSAAGGNFVFHAWDSSHLRVLYADSTNQPWGSANYAIGTSGLSVNGNFNVPISGWQP